MTHVTIPDPDDRHRSPAYDGPADRARVYLMSDEYDTDVTPQ